MLIFLNWLILYSFRHQDEAHYNRLVISNSINHLILNSIPQIRAKLLAMTYILSNLTFSLTLDNQENQRLTWRLNSNTKHMQ